MTTMDCGRQYTMTTMDCGRQYTMTTMDCGRQCTMTTMDCGRQYTMTAIDYICLFVDFHHPSQGNSTNYNLILGLRDQAAPPTSQQINKYRYIYIYIYIYIYYHYYLQHVQSIRSSTSASSSSFFFSWCFTPTETIRFIRDGWMEVGEEGDYVPIATLSPPEWLLH